MEQLLPGTGRFLFCTRLDDDTYPNAIQVSDQQLAAVQLTGDAFRPEWNSRIAGINRQGERNERVRH